MRNGKPPAHCLSAAETDSCVAASLALCVDRDGREVALLTADSQDRHAHPDGAVQLRYAAVFPAENGNEGE